MSKLPQASSIYRRARFREFIGWLLFIPFSGALIFAQRYILGCRIENLREMRRYYAELTRDRRPLLICSNHLSYLDSVLLIYAFAQHFRYVVNYRILSWNLPAVEYSKNPFFALVGFLCKCIFIRRGGVHGGYGPLFDAVARLMREGEPFTIFPEGRRSRTGRFDDRRLGYGIGQIVTRLPETRVLCVYLRAPGQTGISGFPKRGSKFRIETSLLEVRPGRGDREEAREITERIAAQIKLLEERWFAGESPGSNKTETIDPASTFDSTSVESREAPATTAVPAPSPRSADANAHEARNGPLSQHLGQGPG